MLTFDLPHDDPLGVLSSTRAVMERAQAVQINETALRAIAADLGGLMTHVPDWHDPRHYADGTWRTAGWVLVLDALNFCFWSESPNKAKRWQVEWDGRVENGYWALAASLTRAVSEGYPVWEHAWMSRVT